MKASEQSRFARQYNRHLRALRLQGLSDSTIDVYARAVRRLAYHFDCCPDRLTTEQLETYFAELVESHSWSTVKVDRNGLHFFWRHVLKRDWSWLDIVKAPKIQSLPDVLTPSEVEQLIGATRKLRYRVFLLTTYSMGLRLGETLSLQVGDIDGERKRVHIRRGKGSPPRHGQTGRNRRPPVARMRRLGRPRPPVSAIQRVNRDQKTSFSGDDYGYYVNVMAG